MNKPTRPVNLWCSYFFVLAATLQLCSWEPLCAQQRDPAVENVLKNREWKPQVGVGALFPVGSKWALMIDGVTSRLEVNEGLHGPYTDHSFSEFYRVNPGVQNNDLTTQRLIAIVPSFVRLWRRDRFSIYAGGGLGLEHQRQHIRYQQAFPQENPDGSTTLVREEEFVDSRDAVSVISWSLAELGSPVHLEIPYFLLVWKTSEIDHFMSAPRAASRAVPGL